MSKAEKIVREYLENKNYYDNIDGQKKNKEISEKFGVKTTYVKSRLSDYKAGRRNPLNKRGVNKRSYKSQASPNTKPKMSESYSEEEGCIESNTHTIKTLEELLKVSKVNLNVWEVQRYIINKWEVGSKSTEKDIIWEDGQIVRGYEKRSKKMTVQPLYQVKIWLRRKVKQIIIDDLMKRAAKNMDKHSPIYKQIKYSKSIASDPHLVVININDKHIGSLSSLNETGKKYNVKIACDIVKNAVNQIISRIKGYDTKQFIYGVGNDEINIDSRKGLTTSGTNVDCDGLLYDIVESAVKTDIECIDKLRLIAPVHIIQIPGNHDEVLSWFIGKWLESHYRNCNEVTCDIGPDPRKYYRFGVSLLGFTHGRYENIKQLPIIMSKARRKDWADVKYSDFFVADKHSKNTRQYDSCEDLQGIRIFRLPCIMPPTFWAHQRGYDSIRAVETYLYSENRGYSGHLNANV